MKLPSFWKTCLLAGVACLAITATAKAQNVTRYTALPGGLMRIDGTSTIHDWWMEGKLIPGSMEVDDSFESDPTFKGLKGTPKVEVAIPVRSIKSSNNDMNETLKNRMSEVMQEAMKQTEFPKIEYHLTEMLLKSPAPSPGAPAEFNTKGDLTSAGVKKSIIMAVKIQRLENNRMKITGTTAVKMTDFGVKPPAPQIALGLIKTGDDVKITFEWLVQKAAK